MMDAPTDRLAPSGWSCVTDDAATIAFEPDEWDGEVRATRQSDDLWRIQSVERVGEAESTRTVGYVSTRDAALDSLLEFMSAMNRVRDRTGVVRSMLASSLAVRAPATTVRSVTPEWRTADAPYEAQVTTGERRRPWVPEVDEE